MVARRMDQRCTVQSMSTRLPGEPGVWVFVLIDMSFFCLLFASFVYERAGQAEIFSSSQRTLDTHLGLINTLILLTSSWFVVLAVHAARIKLRKQALIFLGLAVFSGAGFVAIKVIEFKARISAGVSLLTNDFYMFYFVITFIHLVHVIAGIVILAVMANKTRRNADLAGQLKGLESVATYWHMVDLLWVMIFPLLYLVSWQ